MGEKIKERICKNPNRDCDYIFEKDQKTNVCTECGFVNERKFVIEEAEKNKNKNK